MKKNVLRIFSLLLYLLAAFTLLSQKIEVEMRTQVETWTVNKAAVFGTPVNLSVSYLFEEYGMNHLFEIREGSGWENGMRVWEISDKDWKIGYVEEVPVVEVGTIREYTFVRAASRVPNIGEQVEVVESGHAEADYLIIYPEGVPDYQILSHDVTILAESDSALIVHDERGVTPFMEHRMKGELKTMASPGWRIFSMADVEQFMNQLPAAAAITMMLLAGLLLWMLSCIQSIRGNSGLIWFHIVIIGTLLAGVWMLLQNVDFPASMLPDKNIFCRRHYQEMLDMVFANLETLGDAGQHLTALKDQVFGAVKRTIWMISGLGIGVVLAECVILRWFAISRKE